MKTGAKSALATAMVGLWLAGCGGGGSSDAVASPNGPITNPIDPMPTASADFVIYEDSASSELLKGPLDSSSWQTFTSYRRGQDAWSRLASGKQLALYRSASSQNDAVTVYDVASGQVVLTQEVPKHTVIAGPVFGNPDQYLLRTYVGASDGGKVFVVNLRAGNVLNTLASGDFDTTIDASPNGRLYRVNGKTGTISTAGPDGVWTEIGRLFPPAGSTIGSWRLNHQGNRIAVVYQWFSSGAASRSDVWVADIDGSNQARLTNQGYIGQPVWSPDDSKLAFRLDVSSGIPGSTGSGGACTYWQVPATARDVSGVSNGQQHAVATQMRINLHGVKNYAPCNVVSWER